MIKMTEKKKEFLTNKQVAFIKADLESNMGYSKILMVGELIKKFKAKGLSKEEILKEIEKFRKENHWDE